ncbi:MAG TPA: hypothetical protein DCK95_10485 [Anaerolineaceae bacterium]|uniref:Methyltransferase type 11 domain-containing protein n=1 Tax=Anaerolinea thermophila TaxID=167964 RepID=A0A124FN80_9CHLR|nr:MAG: hypothetical protein XD73_0024 [Anaerolinea thermophila]HAF62737.1 hypothetical protein [Anaerolineaceae bacterium]
MNFFDLVAPIYDRIFHPALGELCQQGGFADEGVILDIGGGTGRMAQALHTLQRKVIIADLSFPMLRQAKEMETLLPIVADGMALPFCKDAISGVLIADAYHHFQQREHVIQDVARVMKKGGILYIFEPNIRKWTVKLIALMENLLGMHSHFFRIPEIENMVCSQGFQTLETKEEGASIRLCFQKD